jgi:hypothetical protein
VYWGDEPVSLVDATGCFPYSSWPAIIGFILFWVLFPALAGIYDPTNETSLQLLIGIGRVATILAGLLKLWSLLNGDNVPGQTVFEHYRERIENQMQGMIDHEKLSTGEGSFAKRLGAYFVEELLFLLESEDV